jgi:GNAT superfamily N-acetyltransferase
MTPIKTNDTNRNIAERATPEAHGRDGHATHGQDAHATLQPATRPRSPRLALPSAGSIRLGTIHDYDRLDRFHYLAGRPAAHKLVWVIDAPTHLRDAAGPDIAAVLVVSPPVFNVRGRNVATAGRYAGADRREALRLLNRDLECISRVVVHPVFRGAGLSVALVKHAIATAATPYVEALAAMGAIHPLFEKAGMTAWHLESDRATRRLLAAAGEAGLSALDVAAVEPLRRVLAGEPGKGRFSRAARQRPSAAAVTRLQNEVDRCINLAFNPRRRARLADPLAELCRRTARQYVYYLASRQK